MHIFNYRYISVILYHFVDNVPLSSHFIYLLQCDIFTYAKSISVKCCPFVGNFYPHVFTNCGRFILIFVEMALIILRVLIVFTISSFEFYQKMKMHSTSFINLSEAQSTGL